MSTLDGTKCPHGHNTMIILDSEGYKHREAENCRLCDEEQWKSARWKDGHVFVTSQETVHIERPRKDE